MSASVLVPRSQEWHDERAKGLGSSDIAPALGLSTFARPIDIWNAKRGLAEPSEDNAFTEWGRRLEPVIADAARDATGIDWERWNPAIHHRDWPIAFTHVDRRGRDADGLMVALECKSAMSTKGWSDPCTVSIAEAHLVIPAAYAIQTAHHLLCTGYRRAYVAALLGYREFRLYRVETDDAYLDDLLADEQAFWALVESGTEPEPDGSEAYRAHMAARQGPIEQAERSATPEQQLIAARVIAAKARQKEAEAAYELERQRLDNSMGDISTLIGPGWRATRTKGRTTVDRKGVSEDIAALYLGTDGLTHYAAERTKAGKPGFLFTSEE